MEKLQVSSVDELRNLISSLPNECLFRGQNKSYLDENNQVSMPTSMSRHGCVPPLMLKWSYYAALSIRTALGMTDNKLDLHYSQAILQHYGWRSFYIDASASPFVSAWFASHQYSSNRVINACEDCHENYIKLIHETAHYSASEDECYLYVISKTKLQNHNVGVYDLTEHEADNCRPRFHAQDAWMLGPLANKLPHETITAVISGPCNVFSEFASINGYKCTNDLFPNTDEDPIYKHLLSVPWMELNPEADTAFFARELQLPEYGETFFKFHPASTAFIRSFWIFNKSHQPTSPLDKACFFLVPEYAFYGQPQPETPIFTKLNALLVEHETIIFESEGVIRHPEFHDSSFYMKGIILQKYDDGTVHVCELEADHPGTQLHGWSITQGWFYSISRNGQWIRRARAEDCPCGNDLRHELHFWTIIRFEDLLTDGDIEQYSERIYKHSDVNITNC